MSHKKGEKFNLLKFFQELLKSLTAFSKARWPFLLSILFSIAATKYREIITENSVISKENYWTIILSRDIPVIILAIFSIYLCRHLVVWDAKVFSYKVKIFTITSTIFFSMLLNCLIAEIFPNQSIFIQEYQDNHQKKVQMRSEKYFVDFVPVVVLAPIAEETFYRQGLLGVFTNPYGKSAMLVVSALKFTFNHKEAYSPPFLISVFVFAIIFSLIFLKFGLFWSILCHFILNLSAWSNDSQGLAGDIIFFSFVLTWIVLALSFFFSGCKMAIRSIKARFNRIAAKTA